MSGTEKITNGTFSSNNVFLRQSKDRQRKGYFFVPIQDAEHSTPEFISRIHMSMEQKIPGELHKIHANMIQKKLLTAISADVEEIKKILWDEYRCELLVCPTSNSPSSDAHQ